MKASRVKPTPQRPDGEQIGLRSKPLEKSAWDRLPFVGSDHHATYSSWDIPMSGGYFGGIEIGKVVARLYLKYLRDECDNPVRLGPEKLRGMLASLESKVPSSPDQADSVSGQRVGFMGEISTWLEAAAMRLGSSLDAIPERTFIQQINTYLSYSDEAFMNAINSEGRP